MLAQWKAQGKTIVISEHRLYYLRGIADRFVYLEDGRVIHDWTATEFAALLETERTALGLRAYDLAQLAPRPSAFAPAEQIVLEDFHFAYPRKAHVKKARSGLTSIARRCRAGASAALLVTTARGNRLRALLLRP